MAINPIHLGSCSEEIEAALLLSKLHHVHVKVDAQYAPQLLAQGFREAPEALDFLIQLPFNGSNLSQNFQRSLKRSLKQWYGFGLELTVYDVEAYGVDRLVENIYYPLFVKHFYSRGISPYGAHNLASFLEIARPDTYLVVVTQCEHLMGAALLRKANKPLLFEPLGKLIPQSPWVEGLVYALEPSVVDCRRALLYFLAKVFEQQEYSWFSLGRDLVWAGEHYAAILLEKLHWADAVVAQFSAYKNFYRWNEERLHKEGGIVFFEWMSQQCKLQNFGNLLPVFEKIEVNLSKFTGDFSKKLLLTTHKI